MIYHSGKLKVDTERQFRDRGNNNTRKPKLASGKNSAIAEPQQHISTRASSEEAKYAQGLAVLN